MKQISTGAASGCLVWLLTFGVLSMCLCPVGLIAGSLTSVLSADTVVRLVGPSLCPPGSTGKVETYDTTTTDDNGNSQPATGYTMVCQDASGAVVANPGPMYAFVWIALLGVIALVLAALMAIALAAPAGALVARWSGRRARPAKML